MARLFELEDVGTSDDWYTPPWVFEGLGVVFDLDVAAPAGGCCWIPARAHYSESDDGLSVPWSGTVWCNPPYSAPAAWCRRWAAHGDGLILLRSDLSTGGPFAAFGAASSMWVPAKRLQFVAGSGQRASSTAFSTVLLGVGAVADAAIARLAAACGGAARRLVA